MLQDSKNILTTLSEPLFSLVPQGGLVCEECPLGFSAFLSTRPPKGLKNILKTAQSEGRSPCHYKQVRWWSAWNHDQIEGTLRAHGPWYRAYSTSGCQHATSSEYNTKLLLGFCHLSTECHYSFYPWKYFNCFLICYFLIQTAFTFQKCNNSSVYLPDLEAPAFFSCHFVSSSLLKFVEFPSPPDS